MRGRASHVCGMSSQCGGSHRVLGGAHMQSVCGGLTGCGGGAHRVRGRASHVCGMSSQCGGSHRVLGGAHMQSVCGGLTECGEGLTCRVCGEGLTGLTKCLCSTGSFSFSSFISFLNAPPETVLVSMPGGYHYDLK